MTMTIDNHEFDSSPVFAFEIERVLSNGSFLTVSCYDMPENFKPVMEALAIHVARDIDARLGRYLIDGVGIELCFSGYGAVINVTDIKLYGAVDMRDCVENSLYSANNMLFHLEQMLIKAAQLLVKNN